MKAACWALWALVCLIAAIYLGSYTHNLVETIPDPLWWELANQWVLGIITVLLAFASVGCGGCSLAELDHL